MSTAAPSDMEMLVVRQVFDCWSLELPASFEETFVHDDGYWHAYDDSRSISLTSMVIDSATGPVHAESILKVLPRIEGVRVPDLPYGLVGFAAISAATLPARAARCLSGYLATDGRVLIATITSDDEEWARSIWLSIRHHPAERRSVRAIPAHTPALQEQLG
jgi:hypothetical protein